MSIILKRQKTEDRRRKSKIRFEVRRSLGDYSGGVPPLPIPNREVKPASADGTAFVGE
jgi:hypothetical protein